MKTSCRRAFVFAFVFAFVAFPFRTSLHAEERSAPSLFPAPFSAKAITGKVVDAETGEPIPRVVVVAQWLIDRHFVGDDRALLKVMETVTDKGGNYSFPAWGPVDLPSLADFRQGDDPAVAFFKRGYWPQWVTNGVVSEIQYRATPLGESEANGQTIKLQKWDGNKARDYQSRLWHLTDRLPTLYKGGDWRHYPRMAIEIAWVGDLVQEKTKSILGPTRVEGFIPKLFTEEDKQVIRSISDEK